MRVAKYELTPVKPSLSSPNFDRRVVKPSFGNSRSLGHPARIWEFALALAPTQGIWEFALGVAPTRALGKVIHRLVDTYPQVLISLWITFLGDCWAIPERFLRVESAGDSCARESRQR